jgi:hypothetical protein
VLAERQGFEPWIPCGIHAFQACALSHSAISPGRGVFPECSTGPRLHSGLAVEGTGYSRIRSFKMPVYVLPSSLRCPSVTASFGDRPVPQGYYTIEQWVPEQAARRKGGSSAEWVAVLHLSFGASLTDAEEELRKLGKPGFYRIVQMQRVIWAEMEPSGLKLRKSHAGSPASLEAMRQMFERSGGRFPHEKVREDRRRAKQRKPL